MSAGRPVRSGAGESRTVASIAIAGGVLIAAMLAQAAPHLEMACEVTAWSDLPGETTGVGMCEPALDQVAAPVQRSLVQTNRPPEDAPSTTAADELPITDAPTSGPAAAGGWFLVGRAIDDSGAGVPGVSVQLRPARSGTATLLATARTGADGSFRVGPLPDGHVSVHLVHADFVPWHGTAQAAADGWLATLDAGAAVTGTVLDRSGQPVRGAEISLRGLNWKQVCTETDGRFSVRGLRCEQRAVFEVRAAGYALYRFAPIDVGERRDLGVAWLLPEAELRGVLSDAAGPVAGAVVAVADAEGLDPADDLELAADARWMLGSGRSGADGAFRLRGLWPGQFLVTVADPSGNRRRMALLAPAGAGVVQINWTDTTPTRAHLIGDAWDSINGGPLSAFSLTVSRRREEGLWSSRVYRFAGGGFAVRDLAPGEADLRLDAAGYVPWSRTRQRLVAGEQRFAVGAHPRCSVRLEFLDAEGSPVSGARVELQAAAGVELDVPAAIRRASAAKDGVVELPEFPQAPVRLVVQRPGSGHTWTFDFAPNGPGPHCLRRFLQP